MSSLNWLLVTGLEHLYAAHQQGTQQSKADQATVTYPKLKAALKVGAKLNLVQVKRLEKVFRSLGREAYARPDAGMQGLVEANKTLLAGTLDPVQRDLINIALAQTAVHFYIAKYGTLRTYARKMGKRKAVRLLEKTLGEMGKADKQFTLLAQAVMKQKDSAGGTESSGNGAMFALLVGIGASFLAVGVSQIEK